VSVPKRFGNPPLALPFLQAAAGTPQLNGHEPRARFKKCQCRCGRAQAASPDRSAVLKGARQPRCWRVPNRGMDWRVLEPAGQSMQAELERALRENALLVEAIGNEGARGLGLGHRTVSSTQLASSQATALTAHQRSEVAELIRRQERLRRHLADSHEEQLRALTAERDQALEEVGRIEKLRLQDNKTAAAELGSARAAWQEERRGLEEDLQNAVNNSASQLRSRAAGLQAANGPPVLGADEFRGPSRSVRELRQRLNEAQGETDKTIHRAREVNDASYAWCLQQVCTNAVSALREKLAQEATLLAKAATFDKEVGEHLWAVLASNRSLQQIADQVQSSHGALEQNYATARAEADALKAGVGEILSRADELHRTLQAAQVHAESMDKLLAEVTVQFENLKAREQGLISELEVEREKTGAAAAKFAEVRRQISLRAQQENQMLDSQGRQQLPPSIWVELDRNPLFLEDAPAAREKNAQDEDSDDSIISFGFGGRHGGREQSSQSANLTQFAEAESQANLLLDEAVRARDAEAQGVERREMERCVSMLEEYTTWAMRLGRRFHR